MISCFLLKRVSFRYWGIEENLIMLYSGEFRMPCVDEWSGEINWIRGVYENYVIAAQFVSCGQKFVVSSVLCGRNSFKNMLKITSQRRNTHWTEDKFQDGGCFFMETNPRCGVVVAQVSPLSILATKIRYQLLMTLPVVTPTSHVRFVYFCINWIWCLLLLPQLSREKKNIKQNNCWLLSYWMWRW